jgi:hypothetical protein
MTLVFIVAFLFGLYSSEWEFWLVLSLCTGYYVQVAGIGDGGLVGMKVEEERGSAEVDMSVAEWEEKIRSYRRDGVDWDEMDFGGEMWR